MSNIIDKDPKKSNKLIVNSLEKFPEFFNNVEKKYKKKFGFTKSFEGDDKITLEFLEILLEQKIDYTFAFRKLSSSLESEQKKNKSFLNYLVTKKNKKLVFKLVFKNKKRKRKDF